jgi:hypothetical protein
MSERVTAWQCIGCGRIEAPQQCIGVCSDRKVELANAADLDAALARAAASSRQAEVLAAVVRQIANTTPREGACARTWRALQKRARAALATAEAAGQAAPPAERR